MKRDFHTWLSTMRTSIYGYKSYVDFPKIYQNVEKMKVELNIMNSLVGSKNIEDDFLTLLRDYPQILKCIPLLLAVRKREVCIDDTDGKLLFNFKKMNYSVEQYIDFMRKTGLFDLIANHIVNNLVDYVMGIEVGSDSNGRKNRCGHQMEAIVTTYLQQANVEYYHEMYLDAIEEKWNLDLSNISAHGTSTKRFDFVARSNDITYLIETNFYNTRGSKLNETARSYKLIANEASTIDGIKFVWITDGITGWQQAKRNLEETYNAMQHLYNLQDLEDGALKRLFETP